MSTNFKSTEKLENLIPGNTYHIFNKAISNDKLFNSDDDYFYFLQKIERYLLPIANIVSYCLIPNHFHLLVQIKEFENLPEKLTKYYSDNPEAYISKVFSNFFNSYSKSYNKAHNRSGRLFLYPYKRILVEDDDYMASIIVYIHRNPIHHGLTKSYKDWKYSSYNSVLSNGKTKINREMALSPFDGSKGEFIIFHDDNISKNGIAKYLFE